MDAFSRSVHGVRDLLNRVFTCASSLERHQQLRAALLSAIDGLLHVGVELPHGQRHIASTACALACVGHTEEAHLEVLVEELVRCRFDRAAAGDRLFQPVPRLARLHVALLAFCSSTGGGCLVTEENLQLVWMASLLHFDF